MVSLWAYKVRNEINGSTIQDVPDRYREAVKKELGIE